MIIYITGGARSGKSSYAQQKALQLSATPTYVATAKIWDKNFEQRVNRHKADRDDRWENLETLINVAALPIEHKVCVIDCVTLWLTNFFIDTKNDVQQSLNLFKQQIDAIAALQGTHIIVSNEIGMGVHAETEIGRKFTDLQGWANQYLAHKSTEAYFLVSGIPLKLK